MSGPQHTRASSVILTEAETRRLHRFIVRVGAYGEAMRILGLSASTFNAARGYGRMQGTTRERILAAMDREESVAS